jgi:hypothetical protein
MKGAQLGMGAEYYAAAGAGGGGPSVLGQPHSQGYRMAPHVALTSPQWIFS